MQSLVEIQKPEQQVVQTIGTHTIAKVKPQIQKEEESDDEQEYSEAKTELSKTDLESSSKEDLQSYILVLQKQVMQLQTVLDRSQAQMGLLEKKVHQMVEKARLNWTPTSDISAKA